MDNSLSTMPAERRQALLRIANILWSTAWRATGGKGKVPSVATLSPRNLRRWLGAAFACEALISQAKNDEAHQTAIINKCISVLTEYRDANSKVEIE